MQNKIINILTEISKVSEKSSQSYTLFSKLLLLEPILKDMGKAINQVSDDVTHQLYLKFRVIFKKYEATENEINQASKNSQNALSDPQKMSEIRDSIKNVAEELRSLHQNVYAQQMRYIIWVDTNDDPENRQLLEIIKSQYVNVAVKFYSSIDVFKQEFLQYEGQSLFLILSGSVALKQGLFNWLKDKWQQDKIKIRIKSIIIYTSYESIDYIKQQFENENSRLVHRDHVLCDPVDLLNQLYKMISPSKFSRIVDIQEYSFFLRDDLKNKLLQFHIKDLGDKRIKDYHPDRIQLENILKEVQQLIFIDRLNFEINPNQFNFILTSLQKIFSENQDEKSLSRALMRLYSQDIVPFYKLLNITLNIMNEKLIDLLWPVIEMFATALYQYDDSQEPKSLKDKKEIILYKGSTIPSDNFNDICKTNKIISLPGFGSFTPDFELAKSFMGNSIIGSPKLCIFVYTHTIGNEQVKMRPKCTTKLNFYGEEEFITYPCMSFKIASVTQKLLHSLEYYEIKLVLN